MTSLIWVGIKSLGILMVKCRRGGSINKYYDQPQRKLIVRIEITP